MKIVTFLIAAAVMVSAESYQQRLADSTTVLREMSHTSDKGIPQDLLQKAQCVVVVPGLKKIAFSFNKIMTQLSAPKAGSPFTCTPMNIWHRTKSSTRKRSDFLTASDHRNAPSQPPKSYSFSAA